MRMLPKIALILVIAAVTPSAVWAEIKMCNKWSNTLEYSMVWDEGIPVFAPIWKTAGWYTLNPGECRTILHGNVRQEVYLSVREISSEGAVLAVFPLEEKDNYTKGMYGIETFFCVKGDNQPFERTVQKVEQLRECPKGWFSQTYNMMGFTTVGTTITMNFN
jgi:uncharacterized protein DUF1036